MISLVALVLGYVVYGRFVERVFAVLLALLVWQIQNPDGFNTI